MQCNKCSYICNPTGLPLDAPLAVAAVSACRRLVTGRVRFVRTLLYDAEWYQSYSTVVSVVSRTQFRHYAVPAAWTRAGPGPPLRSSEPETRLHLADSTEKEGFAQGT